MDVSGKLPPQNIEAERAVLGSMLIEKEAVVTAAEILKSTDFYRESHRKIFEVMMDLFNSNEPVDLITLSDELKKRNLLEETGGLTYLAELAGSIPTAANIAYHCRIVEEKSLLRHLIQAATKIVAISFEGDREVEEILDSAEQLVFEVGSKRSRSGFAVVKDIIITAFDRIEQLYNNKGSMTGVPSGFTDLDELTSGFQPSDLILIAARPSMGKTSFALNIAQHAAIKAKVPVAVFSLEMSKEQLVQRMLCAEANVDSHKLRTGNLVDEDWTRLARAMGPLSEAPIYIDDTPGISVNEIRAKARRLKAEKGLGLILIDYLQLMQGRAHSENRQQEISEISRSLKALARELNVPLIALSQLSRAPEMRSDHRPVLSDLRESGSQEQDSDLVAFLYRDEYYNPDTEKKNIAEVIVAKHRNGPTGVVELVWLKQFTKFANMERFQNAG